ncbi:MAG: class I SAM-dependent DNA methyltransferase [Caldilineaceae bacterium]
MEDKPQVWHYGLVAQLWDEFWSVNTPELGYLQTQIERYGQPVLDLGCGVGRLLLPLLRAGIDIDGCDISPDMLTYCAAKAKRAGVTTNLYAQTMHEFSLPRRYRTIYICDSFGLAGSRALNQETLRRCYQHLEPGGVLIVNIEAEYASPQGWQLWLKEKRQAFPEPWPQPGARKRAADGSDFLSISRMLAFDPLEQSYTRQMRIEKWLEEKLIAQEEYTLKGYMVFNNEMLLMLQLAGFSDIIVQGDYREETATADHGMLVYLARKKGE